MVESVGNQVTRETVHLWGGRSARPVVVGRTATARIIGAVAIVLLAGSSAFGQFIIQPLKVVVPAPPGRRVPIELILENTTNNTTQNVALRLVDVAQDAGGVWQGIEPDAVVVDGPNGTKLVNVGSDTNPNPVDISNLRSCQSWLRLLQADDTGSRNLEVLPLHRVPIQMFIDVPSDRRGFWCAALLAQAHIGQQVVDGFTSDVVLEFLVPVIVQIQGRPEPQGVELTDVGLEFRPQDENGPAATVVTLSVKNTGGTYSMLKGYARIWSKLGGHWRKLADREFPNDVSIIPGAEFRMRTDVGVAMGSGDVKVEGYLYVDGRRSAGLSKELAFKGDPRVRGPGSGSAALDLERREVVIETQPGQTRSETLVVFNGSEEPINVDLKVALPDCMVDKVAGNVRGDQFECTQWVTVTPTRFTLEGHARTNLRIVSAMPNDATGPNYYAMIQLHATHADGQEGGKTDCRVVIQNRNAQGSTNVQGLPVRLAELSPGRYWVTAQFGNYGNTHLQPTCWAYLTAAGETASGDTAKKFNLSNDILSKSGLMLPLETREFTGVMDVAGVPSGKYRLTAVLMPEKGTPVQKQIGLEIVATADGKTVRTIEIGQPVLLRL